MWRQSTALWQNWRLGPPGWLVVIFNLLIRLISSHTCAANLASQMVRRNMAASLAIAVAKPNTAYNLRGTQQSVTIQKFSSLSSERLIVSCLFLIVFVFCVYLKWGGVEPRKFRFYLLRFRDFRSVRHDRIDFFRASLERFLLAEYSRCKQSCLAQALCFRTSDHAQLLLYK